MNWLRYDRSTAEATSEDLDVISRLKSNDRCLHELAIGDILNDKHAATALAEALRGNTNLKRVIFREYGYYMDNFHKVLAALSETNVSRISVGPTSRILQYEGKYAMAVGQRLVALHSLTKLDLNSCQVGTSGAVVLSALLADNLTLRELHLQDNGIGDGGAAAVAHMLKHRNRSLRELVLDNNGISVQGQLALRNAIFDDSSFNALERSNHILQSYFYNPRSVFGRTVMNDVLSSHAANLRCRSAKAAVTKKLKRVLHKKYRVALRFESFLGLESTVLPHVLGWIARRCDVQMMYELKPILLNLLEGRGTMVTPYSLGESKHDKDA